MRQMLWLLVVAVVFAGGYFAYDRLAQSGQQPENSGPSAARAAPVEVASAELRRIEDRVEAVGTTLSRQAVEIASNASGRVREITFEPGEAVAAGEALARLDDEIERADVEEARAVLREVQLSLERARTLRRSGTVTQATLEQLIAEEKTAQAALDRAERRLDDRVIRAPFDGIVGIRRVDPGAYVSEGATITTLDDRSEMSIEFSLAETLYGHIRPGQPVEATAAAFPDRRFDGEVTIIDSRIDQVGRSFKVRGRLPNPELLLPAGMFMRVTLTLDTREAVMVPEEAVIAEGDRMSVFVVDDGRAERRVVRIGQRNVGAVEILEGLADGEQVVVRGTQRLRDGAPVRVVGDPQTEPADEVRDGDDETAGESTGPT